MLICRTPDDSQTGGQDFKGGHKINLRVCEMIINMVILQNLELR